MSTPPHPGLDHLTNIDELKHLCPAFSSGCPYAKLEEVDSLAVNRGEISRCPAFKEGCPFSKRSNEEIATLMADIPKDHPTLNMAELPSCEDGIALVKLLNGFFVNSQLSQIVDFEPKKSEPELLENPELASAMREGTKVVHRAAETSLFTNFMEDLLEKHKDDPTISLIYFPTELNRKESIEKDLAFFYGQDRVAALTDPKMMTPAVEKFVKSMQEICEANPALLIAHSYSRYLGDLSGGQILLNRLKKSILKYDEKDSMWDSTEGLSFYKFDKLGNQTEFKNFYRERLNAAKVDANTRELIVAEAIRSFELNIALFDEVQEISDANGLIETSLKTELVGIEEIKMIPKEPKRNYAPIITALVVVVVAVGADVYRRYKK